MPITASVGKGGYNLAKDVKYIQQMLNIWLEDQHLVLLKVDGIVGPKTIAAIERYQRSQFGNSDSRVDPNQQTIHKLEEQFVRLSRELKAYLTLALVLSYDPYPKEPRLAANEFRRITNSLYS